MHSPEEVKERLFTDLLALAPKSDSTVRGTYKGRPCVIYNYSYLTEKDGIKDEPALVIHYEEGGVWVGITLQEGQVEGMKGTIKLQENELISRVQDVTANFVIEPKQHDLSAN